MFIKSIKFNKKYINIIVYCFITICFIAFISINYFSIASENKKQEEENNYIKWVDCSVTYEILDKTSKLDISSHNNNEKVKYNWIELIAYLSSKYYGDLKKFKYNDLDNIISKLKNGESMDDITKDMPHYSYYYECYDAIFNQYIGEYLIEKNNTDGTVSYENKYGIKAFFPIAKGYNFNHYDDFGNSRSYGYNRKHLGNDLMGNIGTPVIAVESGIIEAIGWNQYGGWRIGIRSFDSKRYYYYAHLRKDHPYAEDMYVGKVITAGDVIGYLGMTGYSNKENVNNINIPHLHFGIQLIFDESQKDGTNQIWIDVYDIIEFLKKNKSEVYLSNKETSDYSRKYTILEKSVFD